MRAQTIPVPRVVVLTPGPYNSAYFEHCLPVSPEWGTTVEGGDWSSPTAL